MPGAGDAQRARVESEYTFRWTAIGPSCALSERDERDDLQKETTR